MGFVTAASEAKSKANMERTPKITLVELRECSKIKERC